MDSVRGSDGTITLALGVRCGSMGEDLAKQLQVNLHSDALMAEGCAWFARWDVAMEDVGVGAADCGVNNCSFVSL